MNKKPHNVHDAGMGPTDRGFDDPRLLAAVKEFHAAFISGRRPGKLAFLKRHPEISVELDACLDGLVLLHTAAPTIGR